MKTERPQAVSCRDGSSPLRVGEGLLPERSVDVKETLRNEVNARMATADHDRQEQTHRQYKSRIVFR